MADLLIRGMEMPKERPVWVAIFPDGATLEWNKAHSAARALPLPEGHGRLIDADAFKTDCIAAIKEAKPDFIRHEDWLKSCAVTMSFCRDIDERPTIVPAEGGGAE